MSANYKLASHKDSHQDSILCNAAKVGIINLLDYTKFKLKSNSGLIQLLKNKNDIFVVACNKCFKKFSAEKEPECDEFVAFAVSHGKAIAGSVNIDFLCNKHLTAKKLDTALPPDAKNVFVLSCGLGIQTVANLTDLPVYAGSDSVSSGGHHGMALTKPRCEACGQCYLNITGGICR